MLHAFALDEEKGGMDIPNTPAAYEQGEREQKIDEAKLAGILSICKAPNNNNANDINAKVAASRIDEDFYSAALLEALGCFFESTFHASEMGLGPAPKDIHSILTDGRKIGGDSAEGVAILTGLKDAKDFVIVKAPRDPEEDGLLHEFVVGSILNNMRRDCPSFMYCFGGFRCAAPVITGKGKKAVVSKWCSGSDEMVNYVIFEKVKGTAMEDAMEKASLWDFLSWMIQVALGNKRAVEKFGYTHYDLHSGNVLLREVDERKEGDPTNRTTFYIPFVMDDESIIYVASTRVATTIDFGRCHVKYEDRHYGYWSYNLSKDGLYPNKTRPMYDLYRLFGFSCHAALEAGNDELLSSLMPLMDFFLDIKPYSEADDNEERYQDFKDFLVQDRDNFFVLSEEITDWEKSHSIQDFLQWISDQYPDIWGPMVVTAIRNDDLVLTCGGLVYESNEDRNCGTVAGLIKQLSLKTVPSSRTRKASKMPAESIMEIRNTNRRLNDLRAENESNVDSLEYQDVYERNGKMVSRLKTNYTPLRKELIDNIAQLQSKITLLGKAYRGIEFETDVYDSERANARAVRSLFEILEVSNFAPLVILIKRYLADVLTLARLEEEANEKNVTNLRTLRLPPKLISHLRRDNEAVVAYLLSVEPIDVSTASIRDSIVSSLSIFEEST
jgi:hypothetical protein